MVKETIESFNTHKEDRQLLVLVGVRTWIVFVFLVLIAIVFFTWLFVGRIPITVEGRGVFSSEQVYSHFPIEEAQAMKKGMKALVSFDAISAKKYGKIQGRVLRIVPAASSVEIALEEGPNGHYLWTNAIGPKPEIAPGSEATVRVFLDEVKPINYLFPNWK